MCVWSVSVRLRLCVREGERERERERGHFVNNNKYALGTRAEVERPRDGIGGEYEEGLLGWVDSLERARSHDILADRQQVAGLIPRRIRYFFFLVRARVADTARENDYEKRVETDDARGTEESREKLRRNELRLGRNVELRTLLSKCRAEWGTI